MRATGWVRSIALVKSRVEARVSSAGYYAGYFNVVLRETTGGDNARVCELQLDAEEIRRLKLQIENYEAECELQARAARLREEESAALVTGTLTAEDSPKVRP